MAKYLDKTGLTYFWGKVKGWVNNSQHPVGSIYISTSSTFNPQTAWGGTWKKTADGRCLIGASSAYPLGSTGGEKTHYITIDELPSHDHGLADWSMAWKMNGSIGEVGLKGTSASSEAWSDNRGYFKSTATKPTGGGKEMNNMQPYLAVYIWERTA